ncbi:hypothetical protein [Niabella ginsengisoli]|uniref:DUF3857 domain-containing protein n=1 Tax=Niabella ginsengisoli TaxID=522298 RepID=A0ABS9SP63_9BACT|nr:hypothetical protein [Niabella ginsengisoli]MCH5600145.1 hypothetical protein [Niabella ginsengisoli]
MKVKFILVNYCLTILLLANWLSLFAQQQIKVGPLFVTVEDSTQIPYLKYDGNTVVDIRTASTEQKINIYRYEKLTTINKEGQWYDAFWSFRNPKYSIVASFEPNKDEIYVSEINGHGYLVNGTAYVEFANVLIDKSNANDYRYHVVKNDKEEIVSWKKPDQFIKTKDGKFSYAYLGKFEYSPKQQIKIEIYNVKNYADRSTMYVEWVEVEKPVISGDVMYTTRNLHGIFAASVIGINPIFQKAKNFSFDDFKKASIWLIRSASAIQHFNPLIRCLKFRLPHTIVNLFQHLFTL